MFVRSTVPHGMDPSFCKNASQVMHLFSAIVYWSDDILFFAELVVGLSKCCGRNCGRNCFVTINSWTRITVKITVSVAFAFDFLVPRLCESQHHLNIHCSGGPHHLNIYCSGGPHHLNISCSGGPHHLNIYCSGGPYHLNICCSDGAPLFGASERVGSERTN